MNDSKKSTAKKDKWTYVDVLGIKGYPADFVGSSGIEFYIENLLKETNDSKVFFTCYGRNWAKPAKKNLQKNIGVVNVPTIKTKIFDALIYSLISSLIVCFSKSTVVWYHATGTSAFSFLPKLFGKKIIITIHREEWKSKKWNYFESKLLFFVQKLILIWSNVVMAVSTDLVNKINVKFLYSNVRLISPGLFTQQKISKKYSHIYLKKNRLLNKKFVLFLGRLVPEKRIDWIIRAFNNIKNKSVILVIAGEESNTKDYKKRLKNESENNMNIVFVGHANEQEKNILLKKCILFVLPSSVEGNSISLLEAISNNKKCLVADNLIDNELKSLDHITTFRHNSFTDFFEKMTKLLRANYIHNDNQKTPKLHAYNWKRSSNKLIKIIKSLD